MKLLLTGAAGQLGTELLPVLQRLGTVTATDVRKPAAWDGHFRELDFSDPGRLSPVLDEIAPAVIVNAAAYTAVDKAESEGALAHAINGKAPGLLAEWAARHEAVLLHYSTDYVFDGRSDRPYLESDQPSPLNAYGESKLAGEQAISTSGCRHVILRTSWLYSAHGQNFVRTMLRLARERSHLSIVSDQHGCPTWARSLAEVSALVIERMCSTADRSDGSAEGIGGLYHYCDRPPTTWYDFANSIFRMAAAVGLIEKLPQVEAVDSSKFQTAAMRPRNSVLDTGKIERDFRIKPPHLEESLAACIAELKGQ